MFTAEKQNKVGENHQAPASCLIPAALHISSNDDAHSETRTVPACRPNEALKSSNTPDKKTQKTKNNWHTSTI
jgi:hypothetical protein